MLAEVDGFAGVEIASVVAVRQPVLSRFYIVECQVAVFYFDFDVLVACSVEPGDMFYSSKKPLFQFKQDFIGRFKVR